MIIIIALGIIGFGLLGFGLCLTFDMYQAARLGTEARMTSLRRQQQRAYADKMADDLSQGDYRVAASMRGIREMTRIIWWRGYYGKH